MKITIDTKEDSKEEIKKAVQLLSSLVGEDVEVGKDLFSSSAGSSNAFAEMFGGSEVKKGKEFKDKPIDFSNFANLMADSKKEEKKDTEEIPKVVSY